ncbi:Electroneutral sodium bicarbonate exchanger 1 [Cichlidogyrus casuarinus]|uniref:Electroneutral sodium bicarbonate exchanger 1 n=1 Tax=Cichlidogyrus casuarinus TaxID=1844966 RepID=A0ABD2Q1Z7_9PLAT
MTPLLSRIPMAVLYGIFLLMGISSLRGVQFVDRILLLFMPVKYQPDYTYLRHVRLRRVHLFTSVQILCFVMLWVIKQVPQISIMFPLMVLAMCFIRKLLDFIFSQDELFWLDDLMPGRQRSTMPRKGTEIELSSNNMHTNLSMDKKLNISEEVGRTMIWRNLSSNRIQEMDKKSKCEKRKYKKRESKEPTKPSLNSDADDEALLINSSESRPVKFLLDNQEIKTSREGPPQLTAPQITINPPSGRSSPIFKKQV